MQPEYPPIPNQSSFDPKIDLEKVSILTKDEFDIYEDLVRWFNLE